MAFIFYFIVILVSAASVIFGLGLATSPLPSTLNVPIGRVAHAPMPAHIEQADSKAKRAADSRALSPIYPAAPRVPKGAAAPNQASSGDWLPLAPPSQQAAAPAPVDDKQALAKTAQATPQPAVAQSAAHCAVAACSAAYYSFRASDCSYQPYQGPRQLCTRAGGTAAAAAPPRQHRTVERAAQHSAGTHSAADRHELDEVTRIVRKMTRGETGDIAVQDSRGRVIIVHPGRARAYSPYGNYDNGD